MSGQSLLVPGELSPTRPVPGNIRRPEYVGKPAPAPYTGPEVQTPETVEAMRTAGRIAARAMAEAAKIIAPGVTTDQLDKVTHEYLCDHGAYPSTLGYRGFPKSLCTSVNEVICHGIPDSTVLRDGDIVNLDVTAYIGGVHGDNNATYLVGEVDEESRLLVERTREALDRAIRAVKPGRQINVIGRVIESYAKRFGYGVVRDFTGHGISTSFHSGLIIPHYDSPPRHDGDAAGYDVHDRADADARHPRVRHVGRRLDGRDEGPQADRAVRAHPGGDGHRRGRPDLALTPSRPPTASGRPGPPPRAGRGPESGQRR